MKYEGLFILNLAGREEGLNDAVNKVKDVIVELGGKIETVQKMDKRPFSRIADKKFTSGHYVNYIFEAPPAAIKQIRSKFDRDDEIFRIMITKAPKTMAAVAA